MQLKPAETGGHVSFNPVCTLPTCDTFADADKSFPLSLRDHTMRGFAYFIAFLAAIGIMIGIVSYPDQEETGKVASTATSASAAVMTKAGTLTIAVPSMHCEVACFPRVKATLEATEGVQSVVLATQPSEGVLDNRQVVVDYDTGFDLNTALSSLVQEGFPNSAVVE
jgi:copper chaperone CopZ